MKIVSNKLILLLMLSLCATLARAQMAKLKFIVVDSVSRALVSGAEIRIIDTVLKSEIGVITDTNGVANIRLPIGKVYRYYLSANDYYDSREFLLVSDSFEKEISISLLEMQFYACPIKSYGAYFKRGTDIIDSTSNSELVEIMHQLNSCFTKYPGGTLYLSIVGHTSSGRNLKGNYELGLSRAQRLAEYIRSNVKGKCQFVISSAASFKLVNDCDRRKCSEEEHQMNDRATIWLVGFRNY